MGRASRKDNVNKDMGAGMFTAHNLGKRTGPGSLGLTPCDGESW